MLDSDEDMTTRQYSDLSYCELSSQFLRECGGYTEATKIPSFVPVGEANLGWTQLNLFFGAHTFIFHLLFGVAYLPPLGDLLSSSS